MSKFFACLILLGASYIAKAQEAPEVKSILSFVSETLPDETDLSELSTRLYFYKDHPIDVNHAKPEQLKELIFLSAAQVENFFSYIQSAGKLTDLLELQSIDGFDVETVMRIMPFVTLKTQPEITMLSLKSIRSKGENELLLRYGQVLEKQKGFTSLPGSHYSGGPSKFLLRYRYRLDDFIAISFVAEKGAGETLFRGTNKSGFDFVSGSVALSKTGRFSKIIIGDYSLQFGEGLTLWMGTTLGRGADVAGVAKNGTGSKPYTSANESSFFRGTSIKYKLFKNSYLTTFISYKNLDASLTKGSDGNFTLSTISTTGLHRTATEIAHKHNVNQLVYGALGEYHSGSLNIGMAGYYSRYEYEFKKAKQGYKAYAFEGKSLTNSGVHYNYTFKNAYFFGEAAYSIPGATAFINGVMASFSSTLSAVILYRNYSKRHLTFYSQPLGEGSGSVNENGFYGGFHFTPARKWSISFYGDISHFPWLRYRVDQPSSALQIMGQVRYTPRKNLVALLKISTKKGEQNDTSGLVVNPVADFRKDNLRVGIQWQLHRKFGMESRIEITRYQKGKRAAEPGILVYQDADFRPMSSKLSAGFRIAYFNTASYDSRIYAYEDDVLNGSGSGLYNGNGIRFYLNTNYRLSRQMRVWCRYGIYHYPGATKTGSGLDQIEGSTKSEIRIQMRYQF